MNFCHIYFVGRASKDRIILESSSPRSISESKVSFDLKSSGASSEESFSAPHTLKNLKARKESNMTGNVPFRKPQTKFRINAINSNKGYFVLVLKGLSLLIE